MAKGTQCIDHLGNAYESKKAMCAAYGISQNLFAQRIVRGWNLRRALTAPKQELPDNIKKSTGYTYRIKGGTVTVREHYN